MLYCIYKVVSAYLNIIFSNIQEDIMKRMFMIASLGLLVSSMPLAYANKMCRITENITNISDKTIQIIARPYFDQKLKPGQKTTISYVLEIVDDNFPCPVTFPPEVVYYDKGYNNEIVYNVPSDFDFDLVERLVDVLTDEEKSISRDDSSISRDDSHVID